MFQRAPLSNSDSDDSPRETAKRRPELAEPEWRRDRQRPPLPLHGLRLFAACLGLIGTATLLVWVSTWIRLPRSVDLVLLGADYGDNLLVPHNTYGWNVLEDFADLADSAQLRTYGTGLFNLVGPPMELHGETPWQQSLRDNGRRAILVFVSAHGIVDENGPCLLLNDIRSPGKNGRLRLASLLDQLARLPATQQKILLLDSTAMTTQWSLGVLRNGFARSLQTLETRIESIPNLIVISASSPDERSWECGPWRQTVFGHFVLEGLKGGVPDSNDDGRIDAWDLYEGVREETQSWVQANRSSRQTPMILPQGELGIRRARSIDLVPVPRHYEPRQRLAESRFNPSGELTEAWAMHARLAAQIPHPAIYAPCAWRRYRELLLRYEQLLVAQNYSDAASVHRRMLENQQAIERGVASGLSSTENSLAMFETLNGNKSAGFANGANTNAQKTLDTLWTASPASRVKQWDGLQAAAGNGTSASQHMRMALHRLILQRVAERPGANLQTGSELIQLLGAPLHIRPTESHFLVMLATDLPNTTWTDRRRSLVRLALTTREKAEKTAWNSQDSRYACSERVLPHIRELTEKADHDRRLGEDLLFSDPRDYARAETLLRNAANTYTKAASRGDAVSAAYSVHQRAMADIPYYARWSAGTYSGFHDHRDARQSWLARVEAICRETHELGAILDGAPTSADEGDAYARELVAQTGQVRQLLESLKEAAKESWMLMVSADSPQAWCDLHDALQVPQNDPGLRMKLLTRLIHSEWEVTAERRSRSAHVTVEEQTKRAMWSARAQGRMALAIMGRNPYDTLQSGTQLSYDEVQYCLKVLGVEEEHWQAAAKAGRAIEAAWNGIPAAILDRLQAAGKADRSETLQLLRQAESLSRLLPGNLQTAEIGEPADLTRLARFKEVLQWQTQRTYRDHWYAETPDAAPYFRVAAQAYLNDADTLFRKWPSDSELRQRVTTTNTLRFDATHELEMSSQQRMELPVRLVASDGNEVPDGFPVVWVKAGESLELYHPSERRIAWLWNSTRSPTPLLCDIGSELLRRAESHPPSQPEVANADLVLHARFRGQRIRDCVRIQLHLTPDIVRMSYGPPSGGSVAVRAGADLHSQYGDGNGAISIVLDCTGSMGPPEGEPFSANTKYAEATDALGRVLSKLPRGTTVSVWVFGQAIGASKSVEAPEETILQVVAPTRWDSDTPSQLDALLAKIKYPALEPWNESPIVRAILAAKKDVENAEGFKTILVLTDGIDNRVASDGKVNPGGKDVPTLLREAFRNSGIELNVVGFRMPEEEELQGWQQFEVVGSLFPPGTFCTVSESESLAEALHAAMRQRLRYWIETCDHQDLEGMSPQGVEASQSGDNEQWYPNALNPGNYFVRANVGKPIDQEIALNRGDHLLLRVCKNETGLALRQVTLGAGTFPWKPHRESDRWRLTALRNQRIDNDRLAMLLALERNADTTAGPLSVTRPDQSWIEIAPLESTDNNFLVRWNSRWGYPSAAWSLSVPRWPEAGRKTAASPEVSMWWTLGHGASPDVILHRPGDFAELGELRGRETAIRGHKVLVESVCVEDHVVQTGPNERQMQKCLVVRLRYPTDMTVWAQARGKETTGQEHRFYRRIGHYTGLFWPVTEDSATESLQRLELVSLETFKRSAEEHGNALQLGPLPPPDPNDIGPQPISAVADHP